MGEPPDGAPSRNTFPEALAEQFLAEIRVEIARADSKAATLVAALGLASGLFGAMVARSDWSPGELPLGRQVMWWSGTLALAVSLTAFLLAVAPRDGVTAWASGAPLTYFRDVSRAADAGLLPEALVATQHAPQERLVRALTVNSRIAVIKLRWVRIGLATFAAGILLMPMALLTE